MPNGLFHNTLMPSPRRLEEVYFNQFSQKLCRVRGTFKDVRLSVFNSLILLSN